MKKVIESIVVHGQQLGRKLGFPTANLCVDTLKGDVPATGVYATKCILQDGRIYKAMLNVGYRPTVDNIGHELSIEAHLLNFDEDIYDQHIRLVILKRIRDERRMGSLQELSAQLALDMCEVAAACNITTVVFDFGKVLVDYEFSHVMRQILPDDDKFNEFMQLFANQEFIDYCEREPIPFHDIIQQMRAKHPKFNDELEEYYERFPEFVTGEVPGMRDLVLRLKSEGYRVYGLTNWCSSVYRTIQQWDVLRLMDGTVMSCEEHLIKPDVAIYQRLLDRYGLTAEECVFTDDKPVNIEGANRAGMHGILFHDAQQFEQELANVL